MVILVYLGERKSITYFTCFLRLRETHNALQLPVFFFFFFFSFFYKLCWYFGILNRCSWFWKSLNIVDWGDEFNFFWRDSSKNWYKNWYLYFHKTYNHPIWQAGTSIGVDWNETNQAGDGVVITSRSRDFERCYNFFSARVMIIKFWQNNYHETPITLKLTWMLTIRECQS